METGRAGLRYRQTWYPPPPPFLSPPTAAGVFRERKKVKPEKEARDGGRMEGRIVRGSSELKNTSFSVFRF